MSVLMISGSARPNSSNRQLLGIIKSMLGAKQSQVYDIADLPLFVDGRSPCAKVDAWRSAVIGCTSIVISTPTYLHNLPASIKSALEWLTRGGELQAKPVLAITLTPSPPRGDKAMQSLSWTLHALDARVVASLDLYLSDFSSSTPTVVLDENSRDLLAEALKLLR